MSWALAFVLVVLIICVTVGYALYLGDKDKI
jgi:hypothetical protein